MKAMYEALVTAPAIGYCRAHGDSGRGFWGGAGVRGDGAGAGGRGRSARARSAQRCSSAPYFSAQAEVGKGAGGPVPRNTRGAPEAPASRAPKATTGHRPREIRGLHRALERSQAQKDANKALRAELRGSRKEAVWLNKGIARLKDEIARLDEQASASLKDTNGSLRTENAALQKAARASERRCKSLDAENADLRWAMRASDDRQGRLEAWHRDEVDGLNREIDRQRSFRAKVRRERDAMLAPLRKRIDQLRAATARAKDVIGGWRRTRNVSPCCSGSPICSSRGAAPPPDVGGVRPQPPQGGGDGRLGHQNPHFLARQHVPDGLWRFIHGPRHPYTRKNRLVQTFPNVLRNAALV